MELYEKMCKICKKSGQLEYFIEVRNVILCKNCHGIFEQKKSNEIYPNINSKNFLKSFIQKIFRKNDSW